MTTIGSLFTGYSDLGLPREHQLRLLGNGVVPQQAALAVNTLINTDKNVENASI